MTPRTSAGERALDGHSFFVANVQAGFGPFVAVYLAASAWTQGEIGAALSVGTIAGMISQLPGGAIVDAIRQKRLAAFSACLAIAASALMLALRPARLSVYGAEVLHGFASAILPAAIAAMSLALVGRGRLGARLGRNARYAALGNAVAAALFGIVGSSVSEAAVFWLTAALMLPGMAALAWLPGTGGIAEPAPPGAPGRLGVLLAPPVMLFGAVVLLFHTANAAMLPLVAGEVTRSLGRQASLVIALSIVLPQMLVAGISPWVGRKADLWGRRPVLALTFFAVPLRGALLTLQPGALALPVVQLLDGVSAAGFGVLVPLVAADLTRGTPHFTLCMGAFGLMGGLGATISTAAAGWFADRYGVAPALSALTAAGLSSVLLVLRAVPDTRAPADAVAG